MQLAAYISKFAANLAGSFGYVVKSKQCILNSKDQECYIFRLIIPRFKSKPYFVTSN